MNHKKHTRSLALALALALCLAPAARAATIDEVRSLLKTNYIDPIPEAVLNLPTVDEITAAIGDPYTYHMSAEDYAAFQGSINDTQIVGIGAVIEMMADGIRVVSTPADAPAAKAGIRPNDRIVGVDGVSLEQAGSPDALRQLVPGKEGSTLTLTLLRDGATLNVTLTRAKVVFPVVTGEVVDGHIGWLSCSSFGETTGQYLKDYIEKEDPAANRWVMDLRGNPGGYGLAVIEAASYVVGNQDVAYMMNRAKEVSAWRINPFPVEIAPLLSEPLIVLTDNNSASASELFTAAMRDYGTALIIGTRSFGKGVAQNIFELEDGSVMKITTERYYSPQYVTPDRSGVLPHLVVEAALADEVAKLLCAKPDQAAGTDGFTLTLAGQEWHVSKAEAVRPENAPAFAALLAALPPNTPMRSNGQATTPEEISKAWGSSYRSRYFNDVAASPYAAEINTLATMGLLRGTGDGCFAPKAELSRAALSGMLVQAMGYWCWADDTSAPFADVSKDAWYADAANILYHLGIVSGDGQGRFSPNATVNYEQFLTMLGRAGQQADLTIAQRIAHPDEAKLTGGDLLKFHDWARPAVLVADEFDLLPLRGVDPLAPVTREEAAASIYRFMTYTGILSSVVPVAETPEA